MPLLKFFEAKGKKSKLGLIYLSLLRAESIYISMCD